MSRRTEAIAQTDSELAGNVQNLRDYRPRCNAKLDRRHPTADANRRLTRTDQKPHSRFKDRGTGAAADGNSPGPRSVPASLHAQASHRVEHAPAPDDGKRGRRPRDRESGRLPGHRSRRRWRAIALLVGRRGHVPAASGGTCRIFQQSPCDAVAAMPRMLDMPAPRTISPWARGRGSARKLLDGCLDHGRPPPRRGPGHHPAHCPVCEPAARRS